MTSVFNLILLPLRAPMLLVLLVISTYLGLHWSRPGSWADAGQRGVTDLIWSAECLQALVIVVICTIPDLLMRRLASIMAASRVASLVITLLLVITGGLYLLHLDVLTNVLILASAVLLARLDLVRLRVVPPPFVMTLILCVLVLGGITLGRNLELRLRPFVPSPQPARTAPARSSDPADAGRSAPAATRSGADVPTPTGAGAASPQVTGAARNGASSNNDGQRAPNRAMPHLPARAGAAPSP